MVRLAQGHGGSQKIATKLGGTCWCGRDRLNAQERVGRNAIFALVRGILDEDGANNNREIKFMHLLPPRRYPDDIGDALLQKTYWWQAGFRLTGELPLDQLKS